MRDALCATPEPIDACKLLTERANQAGGHDNITVIVVHLDGEGLRSPAPDEGPLKYRKYALPEEPTDNTEPGRRMHPVSSTPPMPSGYGPGSSAPQGLGSTIALQQGQNPSGLPNAGGLRSNRPPHGYEEERIEIPGTHVPGWIVVAIVLAVIFVLLATGFIFLR